MEMPKWAPLIIESLNNILWVSFERFLEFCADAVANKITEISKAKRRFIETILLKKNSDFGIKTPSPLERVGERPLQSLLVKIPTKAFKK
jgi:hypothetical protein